jgi:tetratricopeptide (TPR) repeat protein
MKSAKTVLLVSVACLAFAAQARSQAVRAWQGMIEIPTYALGEEDPNPPFPVGGEHRVYPYTMLDDLTDRLETRTYRALYLENEYLKAIVLPEMGGRLYSLYDKVNRREVFYRNHVVKYGLVALRGAWISGGVEFNFPDGHTVVTVSPVSSAYRQNPDGSATVVVGDMDQVTDMHWEVALTLRPREARLEQKVTLFNPTPLTNLYWFWANAAVPASEDMQFIYPMREAYPHHRGEVWTYPVYEGTDYSWYKNVRRPTSLFGKQVHRSFFGAYYHQADYGVVHVADYREVPGKKVWTWGAADDGLIWTDLLSDQDGPYNEIQAGRFETQLNYEFMPPRRVDSFTEYWYPVKEMGDGFVEATSELAMNVHYPAAAGTKPSVEFVLFPSVGVKDAKVKVKLGAQLLRSLGPVSLEPMKVVHVGVPVEDLAAAKAHISAEVESSEGRNILRWSAEDPVDGNPDLVPGVATTQPASPDKLTVEELYLRGVEQEKDGNEEAATATYGEVLRRDPGFMPALLKQAWQYYRSGNFDRAEQTIMRAMGRDPSNPEVQYAAGVVERASVHWTLAQDAFWASVHYGGPPAPAFAQLGEIAIHQKKYADAAALLQRALTFNPADAAAQADLAVALRLSADLHGASQAIEEALRRMPLFPFALAERERIKQAREKSASPPGEGWMGSFREDVQNYLEVAAWYRGLNDLTSSDFILQRALRMLPSSAISPLVYYYLAVNAWQQNKAKQAEDYAAQAAAATYDKVFPNRIEDCLVLILALAHNSKDSRAAYFWGNWYFAHGRYEDAAGRWSRALKQGFESPALLRNLGLYAWRIKKDLTEAGDFYARAIRLAPEEYRLYVDLDEIYAQSGDLNQREKLFAQAPPSVRNHDTVLVRLALLETQQKHYDRALELLIHHRFKPWEGGAIVREMFVLANVQKGRQAMAAKNASQAEAAFRQALAYPHNLGVGKPDQPHDEEALYWLGEALAAQDKNDAAREAWNEAAAEGKNASSAAALFAGLALRRLGQSDEAARLLEPLAIPGAQGKAGAEDFYLAGLLALFDDHKDQASSYFGKALELDPSFWQARIELQQP